MLCKWVAHPARSDGWVAQRQEAATKKDPSIAARTRRATKSVTQKNMSPAERRLNPHAIYSLPLVASQPTRRSAPDGPPCDNEAPHEKFVVPSCLRIFV